MFHIYPQKNFGFSKTNIFFVTISATMPSKPMKISEIKQEKKNMQNIQVTGKVKQKKVLNHPYKKHCIVRLYDETDGIRLHLWNDQTKQVEDDDKIYFLERINRTKHYLDSEKGHALAIRNGITQDMIEDSKKYINE